MNPIDLLESEHRRLLDALGQCAARPALVRSVAADLRLHMRVEEDILYPALSHRQRGKAHAAVHRALEQHHRLDGLVGELLELEPDDPGFAAGLDALRGAFETHVGYEEDGVFQDVASSLPPPRLAKVAAAIASRLGHATPRAQRSLEKT